MASNPTSSSIAKKADWIDLYTVKVVLYSDGREIDCWEKRIGLRTMNMRREKDEWGECFAHEVNGAAVFAMGADYIPEDNLLGRVTPETTRKLLEKARFAIGHQLIGAVKQKKRLSLHVFEKNTGAMSFYLAEGFKVWEKMTEKETGETECLMVYEDGQ